MSQHVNTPVQLYRHLLRCIKKLPASKHEHYKHHVRQGFRSHADETDPDRVRQIITRATEDAVWLVQKYAKP